MTTDAVVLVVGDLVTDVVAHLAEPLAIGSDAAAAVRMTGGGSAANVAAWLGWSRVPVVFAGRVGRDAAGQSRVRELEDLGVTVHAVTDEATPTGTIVVLVTADGERTMLPDRGANANLAPADLDDELFAAGRHLHLSGYTLLHPGSRAAGLHALDRARAAGMTISIDPASSAPLRTVGATTFLEWTRGADLCLPNRGEATVLTGEDDAMPAARRLAQQYRQVVITLGDQGALWSDGVRVLQAPAAAASAGDTTGAGDAFTAGFLGAFLAGADPADALRRGNELAAQAVGVHGARPTR